MEWIQVVSDIIDAFQSTFSLPNGYSSLADLVPQRILWRACVPVGALHLLSVPWIQSHRMVLEP